MGKRPCCSKVGLNKGAWSKLEDKILTDYIKVHGEGSWNNLPNLAGLKRCGKSCRLRWVNYLRPDVKRGNISQDEEDLIMRMHKLIGNRWSIIAGRLPGRTDNEIKNYWNTSLRKKLETPSSKVANINRKFNKEKSPKQALEPKNSVDSSHSHVPVEAIRVKAFRITSKTQTVVTTPTKCQYPSIVAGEEKDSNGEMMLNRHLVVDHGYLTPEAADLMINYCDDPKMNDSTCGTSGDHVSSPPIFSEQELEYWFNSSCSNIFNECTTSTFEDVLGDLDFGHLATVLDSDGMKKKIR